MTADPTHSYIISPHCGSAGRSPARRVSVAKILRLWQSSNVLYTSNRSSVYSVSGYACWKGMPSCDRGMLWVALDSNNSRTLEVQLRVEILSCSRSDSSATNFCMALVGPAMPEGTKADLKNSNHVSGSDAVSFPRVFVNRLFHSTKGKIPSPAACTDPSLVTRPLQ